MAARLLLDNLIRCSKSGPGFGDGMQSRSLGRGLALVHPCTVRFLQEAKHERTCIDPSLRSRGPDSWAAFRPQELGRFSKSGPAFCRAVYQRLEPSSAHKLFTRASPRPNNLGCTLSPKAGPHLEPRVSFVLEPRVSCRATLGPSSSLFLSTLLY